LQEETTVNGKSSNTLQINHNLNSSIPAYTTKDNLWHKALNPINQHHTDL